MKEYVLHYSLENLETNSSEMHRLTVQASDSVEAIKQIAKKLMLLEEESKGKKKVWLVAVEWQGVDVFHITDEQANFLRCIVDEVYCS